MTNIVDSTLSVC